MASFLIRVLSAAGLEVPTSAPDAFDDDEGTAHEQAINPAAALGVVDGVGDRRYDPGAPVTRAEAAALPVGDYESTTGQELPPGGTAFTAIAARKHREASQEWVHTGAVHGHATTAPSPRP